MIHNIPSNTIVRDARDPREQDRMTAYQSIQKTQADWARFKSNENESVERDGVTLTISGKARTQVINRPDAPPITEPVQLSGQPERLVPTEAAAAPEMRAAMVNPQTGNLNVIMQRMRELSLETMQDQLPEALRQDKLQEMKRLIEEAERINKQSRAKLQGMMVDPVQAMRMQRAAEAFQAHKKPAPQDLPQAPVEVVRLSGNIHNVLSQN